MYDSLKMFSSLPTKELSGKSLEEIVDIYQSTKDEKLRNKCFCKIFCEVFPMLLKLFKNASNILSMAEKTEVCIYGVIRAMNKYKRDQKTKFTSYLYGNISRHFITMKTNYTNNNKKKIWSNMLQAQDDNMLRYILNSQRTVSMDDNTGMFIDDLENSSILSSNEFKYCKALLLGYKQSKEIIPMLDFEPIKKFDKETKTYITQPLDDKKLNLMFSKLKRKLKQKIKDNSFNIF